MTEAEVLLRKAKRVLHKLKLYGTFWSSEIEIDIYKKPHMDGEDFEKMINKLLKEIREYDNTITKTKSRAAKRSETADWPKSKHLKRGADTY